MTPPQIPGIECLDVARENSTAITWRAIQRSLDRVVSVRVLKPDVTELQCEAYETVARAVARIKHPNLIQVIDVARCEDGTSYAILESVEGVTLKEELAHDVQFDLLKAVRVGAAVADALDAAWKQTSLIHRNLKPEDICITHDGTIKIVEFSAATIVQPGLDPLTHDGGMIVGTPAYMSPEQAQGRHDLDFHADIYGLGALLYHLVTGVAPFAFEPDPARVMELQVTGSLPSARAANAKVTAGMDAIIARCMMKDARARYAWWQDVLADLQRVAKGRPVTHDAHDADSHSLSTIAAYVPPKAGPGRPHAIAKGAVARVEARESGRAHRDGPDVGTRFLLWVLLLAALGTLAALRWNRPDGEGLWRRVLGPGSVSTPSPTTTPPHDEPEVPRPTEHSSPNPVPGPSTQPGTPPTQSDNPPSTVADPATPPYTDPATPDPDLLPEALVQAVTDALLREDMAAARALLKNAAGRSGGENARAAALKTLESPVQPDDLVGIRLLERYRGRPTRVTYQGRELTIVPDRYAAGFAMVELVATDGSRRPWSMKISTLAVADRLRFFGIPADEGAPNPETDMAIALLSLASEDRDLMRRMAVRVPSLAPFLLYAAGH